MNQVRKGPLVTANQGDGVHSPLKPIYLHNLMQRFQKKEHMSRGLKNHDAGVRGINQITNCSTTSDDAEQPTQGGTNE